jgi:hypothetical protein
METQGRGEESRIRTLEGEHLRPIGLAGAIDDGVANSRRFHFRHDQRKIAAKTGILQVIMGVDDRHRLRWR